MTSAEQLTAYWTDRLGRISAEIMASRKVKPMTIREFVSMSSSGEPVPIVFYPSGVLRMAAAEVPEVTDELRYISRIMFDLMYANNGCGLAAPQVGLPIRMFVVNPTGRRVDQDKEKVFINPDIFHYGPRTAGEVEGCLSLPGCRAVIDRPRKAMLTYTDLDGKKNKACYEGLMGRIVQHEFDHLNGKLIIDRMTKPDYDRVRPALTRLEEIARHGPMSGV